MTHPIEGRRRVACAPAALPAPAAMRPARAARAALLALLLASAGAQAQSLPDLSAGQIGNAVGAAVGAPSARLPSDHAPSDRVPGDRVPGDGAPAGAAASAAPGATSADDDEFALPSDDPGAPVANDPWERTNRAIFRFNDRLDRVVLQPVARGFETVVPEPVRLMVSSFFSNLGDLWIGANNLMQGKVGAAASDFARFGVNTTLGVFGVADVASEIGLPKHREDFGQTLGRWGVGEGPYLVLPVLGPSTLRDAGGTGLDLLADPVRLAADQTTRTGGRMLRGVSTRASLLGASKVADEIALDPYVFMRDAYLQRRRSLVSDGGPAD